MTSRIHPEEYEALANFRCAIRKFLRFSKEFLGAKTNSLTSEQYEALLALKAFSTNKGLLVGEVGERLQVKHHTAVALTDKLVAQRLVTKRRRPSDRRHVYVKLTKLGSELLESLAGAHRNEMRIRSPEMIKALSLLKK
jgi:DNA-binding MarR family transcriptional regulator